MSYLGSSEKILGCALGLLLTGTALSPAQTLSRSLCPIVLHEERLELEEFQLDLDLARSDFAAYEEIFALIEELWESEIIERMTYLKAKYDRDSAKIVLERAERIVERQRALLEQYRIACEARGSEDTAGDDSQAIREARIGYLEAHCRSLSKAVEVAEVNLDFNRLLLENILDLHKNNVAAKPDVILAELDVEREEKRLKDAKRRFEACGRQLGGEKGDGALKAAGE